MGFGVAESVDDYLISGFFYAMHKLICLFVIDSVFFAKFLRRLRQSQHFINAFHRC